MMRFVERLKVYRDRMLHVDWRNRSILLRKAEKKWAFDLGSAWQGSPEKLDDVLKKAVWTRSAICLIKDSDQSDEANAARSNLTYLERSARTIFEETGLSDLYLGFPFLVGQAGAENFVRAPLILFPVRLEKVRRDTSPGWYLTFAEDEYPVVNRALLAALKKACGIVISEEFQDHLDDILDQAPRDGLSSHLVAKLNDELVRYELPLTAEISSQSIQVLRPLTAEEIGTMSSVKLHLEQLAVVGNFPQGSTAIFHDYELMIERAQAGETDQGVIDDLLETPYLRTSPMQTSPAIDLDSLPDREMNLVLPTDSSQDAVIVEAQRAECVVVRGPPGTGKSQVIVNLITSALARKERVLVVCQKRAALDVVHQRLGRAGLQDSVVLLHDARADRPGTYSMLTKRMDGDPPAIDTRLDREFAETTDAIDHTISELNSIVKPMWAEYFGGARLQELYTAALPGYVPKVEMGTVPNRLSRPSLASILQKLPELQIGHWKYDSPNSPIALRRSFATIDPNAKFDIDVSLLRMTEAALPSALPLNGLSEQENALRRLADYEAMRNRTFRFINPRWWKANGTYNQIRSRFQGDPRVQDTTQMRGALTAGLTLLRALQELQRWMRPEGLDELRRVQSDSVMLRSRIESVRSALADFDKVQEYDKLVASLDPSGQEVFELCASRIAADEGSWARIVEQEVITRWISSIEYQNRQLAGDPFSRYLELKSRLTILLEKRRELFKRRLAHQVLESARRPLLPPGEHHPNKRPETDWNKLLSEFSKKRRVKPVRRLMEEFPFQMMTIAPCWLVSPEAASEIFPLDRGMFDTVIFDESSQLAVERALPSLYRGKRTLIAGDEKQLRPFDLFQSKEEDEEPDEVTEAESLLVLSMRVLSPRYLSWHYRSRYQELIDFSNHAFYDGNLQIAANVQRKFELSPIDFIRCDGVWEERTNSAEAEKVVDVIHWLLSEGEMRGRMPSIGVITFNEPQRDLVDDRVEARRTGSEDFDRLYSSASRAELDLDERPFVKNIENVQGDERDVIIFSVGYAPDRQGKFRVQFGSLNQEGGENRLNVAVTRAKERVIMVASFDPSQLPVEGAKNAGPMRLKEYLLYAKAVSEMRGDEVAQLLRKLDATVAVPPSSRAIADFDSPLETQVRQALEALGLRVESQVGFSGYRIDLAVVDPKDDSRYVIGIECDGATFHSARSARERDVGRQRFLEDRGWTIERVWSRNWWRDRQGEIARLQRRIQEISKAKKPEERMRTAAPTSSPKARTERRAPEDMTDRGPASVPDVLAAGASLPEKDDRSMRFIFFKQLEARTSQEIDAAKGMLDWADGSEMRLWWREVGGVTAVTPYFKHGGIAHWSFSLRADGVVDLHFQYLKAPFDVRARRLELIRRLNSIPNVSIPEEYANKTRTLLLSALSSDEALDLFIRTLEWYEDEVKRSEGGAAF